MKKIFLISTMLFLGVVCFAQKQDVQTAEGRVVEENVETEEENHVGTIIISVVVSVVICVLLSPPVLMRGWTDERLGNWCENFGRD